MKNVLLPNPGVRIIRLIALLMLITMTAESQTTLPGNILDKSKIRILITDSGLGGLSVAAGIDSMLSARKAFERAEIIFCNALPESNFRYNQLPDADSKARVFSSVLSKMDSLFRPDVILIACNTLSVVYPLTAFSRTARTPVIGIVECGTEVLLDSLRANPGSVAAILGTETTIQSKAHENALFAEGIAAERITTQSFPNLESEIQTQPDGDMTANLIEFFLDEMKEKFSVPGNDKFFAALCCTHYGYAAPLFANKLKTVTPHPVIINPNSIMIRLFDNAGKPNVKKTKVTVSVFSQAPVSPEEADAIGRLITRTSEKTAKALKKYTRLRGVFAS